MSRNDNRRRNNPRGQTDEGLAHQLAAITRIGYSDIEHNQKFRLQHYVMSEGYGLEPGYFRNKARLRDDGLGMVPPSFESREQ